MRSGAHDDIANAVGGGLTLAVGKPRAMVISDELLESGLDAVQTLLGLSLSAILSRT